MPLDNSTMTRAGYLSCLLIAAALAACGRSGPAETPRAAVKGERLVVQESLIPDNKPVDAVVATADLGEARARIGGTLTRLLVTENDRVRKGQLLAVVTDPRIDMQTSAYASQAAAARAEAERASRNLGRVRTLYAKGFYAKAGLDDAEAAAKAARAALDAAQAQRQASAELSGQGAILAPGDGRVISARVPAGTVVSAGQSVVSVATGAPVLRLEIPERQATALQVGSKVSVLADDGRVTAVGVVRKVYPAVSAGRVVADIDAPQAAASVIGAKVRVSVTLGTRRAIVVPSRYVTTRFGLDYVRLVGSGGAAFEAPVQVAARAPGDPAVILSGLQPGDVLVPPGPGR